LNWHLTFTIEEKHINYTTWLNSKTNVLSAKAENHEFTAPIRDNC